MIVAIVQFSRLGLMFVVFFVNADISFLGTF